MLRKLGGTPVTQSTSRTNTLQQPVSKPELKQAAQARVPPDQFNAADAARAKMFARLTGEPAPTFNLTGTTHLANANRSGLVSQATNNLPATGPLTVEQATAEVKRLLQSNIIDDVSHDDLMAIEAILRRVPQDQVNEVIAGLSDAELQQWVEDINDPGFAGHGPFRGLNETERGALFSLLANNLEPQQAGRFFTALDQPEQMIEFGEAFIQQGNAQEQLGFLDAIGDTSFPNNERAASSRVIASALDALTADPASLATAVNSLSEQNLQDGLLGAAGVRWNEMGPFGGQLHFSNMDRLQRINDALAGTEDHRARAAMFDGMGYVLREMVQAQPAVQDKDAVTDRVTGMMTGLLSDDLPEVLTHLSGENGVDPTGSAFTAYAREQLIDGGGTLGALAEQLRELDMQDPGANGRYDNAFLTGYFSGAALRAVETLTPEDMLGKDLSMIMPLVNLYVSFRTDPATGLLLGSALSEAERATIGEAMTKGGEQLRRTILDMFNIDISPGNDNGTAVGGFEQGLLAVYGSQLYESE